MGFGAHGLWGSWALGPMRFGAHWLWGPWALGPLGLGARGPWGPWALGPTGALGQMGLGATIFPCCFGPDQWTPESIKSTYGVRVPRKRKSSEKK